MEKEQRPRSQTCAQANEQAGRPRGKAEIWTVSQETMKILFYFYWLSFRCYA